MLLLRGAGSRTVSGSFTQLAGNIRTKKNQRKPLESVSILSNEIMEHLNAIKRPHMDFKEKGIKVSKLKSEELYEMSRNKSDIKLSLALLFEAALKGNSSALNDLGFMIATNEARLNFKCQPTIGIEFLKSSAELGDAGAYLNLAHVYLNGIVVPQNIAKALECYEMADKIGHKDAKSMMEYVKKAIQSVPERKQAEFVKLIMKDGIKPLAEILTTIENEADRTYALAVCYYEGKWGVTKDIETGIEMLYQAVEMGSTKAQRGLGLLLRSGGEGMPQNIPGGTATVFLAALNEERPSAKANYDVAMFYLKGSGVEKDWDKALKYLQRAEGFGSIHAKGAIEFIKKELAAQEAAEQAARRTVTE